MSRSRKNPGSLGGLAAILLGTSVILGCSDNDDQNSDSQNNYQDNPTNTATNDYSNPATNAAPAPVNSTPAPAPRPEPAPAPEPQIPRLQTFYIGGHMYEGESDSEVMNVRENSKYAVWFDYSNDDNDQKDRIAIYADNECLGIIDPPQDTGDWGYGWANYVSSPVYRFETKRDQTKVKIKIQVLRADSYGFRVGEGFLKKID